MKTFAHEEEPKTPAKVLEELIERWTRIDEGWIRELCTNGESIQVTEHRRLPYERIQRNR